MYYNITYYKRSFLFDTPCKYVLSKLYLNYSITKEEIPLQSSSFTILSNLFSYYVGGVKVRLPLATFNYVSPTYGGLTLCCHYSPQFNFKIHVFRCDFDYILLCSLQPQRKMQITKNYMELNTKTVSLIIEICFKIRVISRCTYVNSTQTYSYCEKKDL